MISLTKQCDPFYINFQLLLDSCEGIKKQPKKRPCKFASAQLSKLYFKHDLQQKILEQIV